MRRRMRLRTTAPPRARFTLAPKRLCSSPFLRKNTTNCRLERRWPPRYTASKSSRRTNRAARGQFLLFGAPAERELDGREAMATLLATRGQNLASSLGLHARAKAVRLVAAAHFGLKGAFRQ